VCDTFEKLDLILLMCREADRPWTARAASTALRIPAHRLQIALTELCGHGVASHRVGAGFRLELTSALGPAVASLGRLYDEAPTAVLNGVMAASIARGASRFAAPGRRARRG
jgi:hypothetical protein